MMCRHVCYKLNCFSYTNNHLKCDSSPLFGVTGVIWWVLWSFELQCWCHLYSSCAYFWYIHWIGKCHCISLAFIHEGIASVPLQSITAPSSGRSVAFPSPTSVRVLQTNQSKFVWLIDLWIIASGATFFFSCKVNSSDWRLIVHPQIYQDTLVSIAPKCQH